jgi:hypothetical protein
MTNYTELVARLRLGIVHIGTVKEAADAIESLLKGGGVPEGMQLVPIEPTRKMFEAARCEFDRNFSDEYLTSGYRAMLCAAPSKPDSVHVAEPTETSTDTRLKIAHITHNGAREPQIWFDGKPVFSMDDTWSPEGRAHVQAFCDFIAAKSNTGAKQ